MSMRTIFTVCLVCSSQVLSAQPESANREDDASVSELQQLTSLLQNAVERLERVEQRLDELELQMTVFDFEGIAVDTGELADVTFPENSTRAALREYVRNVNATSRGQQSHASDDPQIAMLKRVGEENVDLLLESGGGSYSGTYYNTQAALQLASEQNKDMILAALSDHPDLVEAVVDHGWEEDVRDVLVEGLQSQEFLPLAWVEAVANFRDPDTYDALLAHFEANPLRSLFYEMIRDLPGIDLEPHVDAAWENAKAGEEWPQVMTAVVAMQYGHKDALKAVVENMHKSEYMFAIPGIRAAIRHHTTAHSSGLSPRKWYETYEDEIVFDPADRRFKVQP